MRRRDQVEATDWRPGERDDCCKFVVDISRGECERVLSANHFALIPSMLCEYSMV